MLKRFIHRVSLLVLIAFCIAAGAALVVAGLANEARWHDFAQWVERGRLDVVAFGGVLVLLPILYMLSGLRRRSEDQMLSFPNDEGAVSLGVNGISDYLAKLTTEFSSVIGIQPKIVPIKDQLDIVLDIRIKAGPDVRDVCELLQAQARRSLLEGLGISNVRNIAVNVVEIVSERKSPWRSDL